MGDSFDVAIAGGGIVGAACAAECAAAGLKAVVVESGPIGGGATAAGMGHIAVMDDSPAQLALTAYSQRLWRELAPRLPDDVEYLPCGSLWVATDEQEMAEVVRKKALYDTPGVGVRAEVLDAKAVGEAEPNLRPPGLAGALRLADDAVLYPPCAARYLLEQSRAKVIHESAAELSGRGIRLESGRRIDSGFTVNATGAWAKNCPVRKRKGHLVITDRYPGYVRHVLVELGYLKSAHTVAADSVAFNVQPRRTGQLLIGSSRQYGAEDTAIDTHILNWMMRRVLEYMPGLASLTAIRCWTGFRAATPDKLPLIGPTEDPRLYLATGHEGLGITTSLATARLLVDHMLRRRPAIPVEPYLPCREMSH